MLVGEAQVGDDGVDVLLERAGEGRIGGPVVVAERLSLAFALAGLRSSKAAQ